jgi:hypothetical protein
MQDQDGIWIIEGEWQATKQTILAKIASVIGKRESKNSGDVLAGVWRDAVKILESQDRVFWAARTDADPRAVLLEAIASDPTLLMRVPVKQ